MKKSLFFLSLLLTLFSCQSVEPRKTITETDTGETTPSISVFDGDFLIYSCDFYIDESLKPTLSFAGKISEDIPVSRPSLKLTSGTGSLLDSISSKIDFDLDDFSVEMDLSSLKREKSLYDISFVFSSSSSFSLSEEMIPSSLLIKRITYHDEATNKYYEYSLSAIEERIYLSFEEKKNSALTFYSLFMNVDEGVFLHLKGVSQYYNSEFVLSDGHTKRSVSLLTNKESNYNFDAVIQIDDLLYGTQKFDLLFSYIDEEGLQNTIAIDENNLSDHTSLRSVVYQDISYVFSDEEVDGISQYKVSRGFDRFIYESIQLSVSSQILLSFKGILNHHQEGNQYYFHVNGAYEDQEDFILPIPSECVSKDGYIQVKLDISSLPVIEQLEGNSSRYRLQLYQDNDVLNAFWPHNWGQGNDVLGPIYFKGYVYEISDSINSGSYAITKKVSQ